MKTVLCTFALLLLATTAAKADSVTITFDQPDQTVAAGNTVDFTGTITNDTDSTIYLNSDDINLAGSSLSNNDFFLINAPLTLDAGASSGDIDLFQISASYPLQDAAGLYPGTYTIFGGADGDAQDNLGQASFSVTTTAPEPSVTWLLLIGTLMSLVPVWKMSRAQA